MKLRGLPVFLLVGAFVCSCGGSGTKVSPGAAPPPYTPPPSSGSPAQTAVTPGPSGSPTSALGLVVDGKGSDLTAPQSPTTRSFHQGGTNADCYGIGNDPGFTGSCQLLRSPLGTAVAQVEVRGVEERTLLWTVSAGQAGLALRRVRTLAQPAGSVNAQDGGAERTAVATSDINNDGTSAFVVETPSAAGQQPPLTALDIVQTSGLVGLHRNLHGGFARKADGGGLETWTALDDGRFEHSVFQFQSGAWRIVEDGVVERRQIPTTSGGF